MAEFEFAFSLFGLLLGFTLVEVLSGLARSIKRVRTRHRAEADSIRIGWLTPILALFVLLDVSSYWENVWSVRHSVTVGFDFLFGGLLITGTYYFAASMVFPDDLKNWPDLDEWFWSHRRQALAPLFVANAAWMAYIVSMRTPQDAVGPAMLLQAAYFVPLAIAIVAKRPVMVGGALVFLNAAYLYFAIASAVSRVA